MPPAMNQLREAVSIPVESRMSPRTPRRSSRRPQTEHKPNAMNPADMLTMARPIPLHSYPPTRPAQQPQSHGIRGEFTDSSAPASDRRPRWTAVHSNLDSTRPIERFRLMSQRYGKVWILRLDHHCWRGYLWDSALPQQEMPHQRLRPQHRPEGPTGGGRPP